MDFAGRKVESQVQFWSLLGPLLFLLSVAVLLFKVSVHWVFPVSALIGIPLCAKWKMKGMAVALCTLLIFSGIGYQNLELDDRYWHVGLSLAMAFSFIVMTLSLEEVQALVGKLQIESQSRLDNLALLDEKLKAVEQALVNEKELGKAETASIHAELSKAQEEKQTFHKLAQLSKEELTHIREQHDVLFRELQHKKQRIADLSERLEQTELSLQEVVNSDGEQQVQALSGQLAALERDKEALKTKISLLQSEAQAAKNKLSFLEEERQACLQSKTSLQQQCEHMRQIESQQRQLLLQTQQKNHELKIQLMEEEQHQEAAKARQSHLEEQISRLEKQAINGRDELSRETVLLKQELAQREERFHHIEKKFQNLESLKADLELILQQTQTKLLQAEQKLHDQEAKQQKQPEESVEGQQTEALYLQLKQQFKEKSDMLDATRKELFHLKEQILKKQKEEEEERLYSSGPKEKAFERSLLQLGRRYEEMYQLYQTESEELSNLIEHLFRELSALSK